MGEREEIRVEKKKGDRKRGRGKGERKGEEGEEGEDKEDSEREDNLRSGNLLHRNLAQGISPSITTSFPTRSKSPAYMPPPRNPELV